MKKCALNFTGFIATDSANMTWVYMCGDSMILCEYFNLQPLNVLDCGHVGILKNRNFI